MSLGHHIKRDVGGQDLYRTFSNKIFERRFLGQANMQNYLLIVSVHSEQGVKNRGDSKDVSVILEMLKFLTEH